MAKAGTPKKKKAKPKLTDKEQSERFKETARKIGVDEDGRSFEEAFNKITGPPKGGSKV
jgi:ribosomal protein S6E (S10)